MTSTFCLVLACLLAAPVLSAGATEQLPLRARYEDEDVPDEPAAVGLPADADSELDNQELETQFHDSAAEKQLFSELERVLLQSKLSSALNEAVEPVLVAHEPLLKQLTYLKTSGQAVPAPVLSEIKTIVDRVTLILQHKGGTLERGAQTDSKAKDSTDATDVETEETEAETNTDHKPDDNSNTETEDNEADDTTTAGENVGKPGEFEKTEEEEVEKKATDLKKGLANVLHIAKLSRSTNAAVETTLKEHPALLRKLNAQKTQGASVDIKTVSELQNVLAKLKAIIDKHNADTLVSVKEANDQVKKTSADMRQSEPRENETFEFKESKALRMNLVAMLSKSKTNDAAYSDVENALQIHKPLLAKLGQDKKTGDISTPAMLVEMREVTKTLQGILSKHGVEGVGNHVVEKNQKDILQKFVEGTAMEMEDQQDVDSSDDVIRDDAIRMKSRLDAAADDKDATKKDAEPSDGPAAPPSVETTSTKEEPKPLEAAKPIKAPKSKKEEPNPVEAANSIEAPKKKELKPAEAAKPVEAEKEEELATDSLEDTNEDSKTSPKESKATQDKDLFEEDDRTKKSKPTDSTSSKANYGDEPIKSKKVKSAASVAADEQERASVSNVDAGSGKKTVDRTNWKHMLVKRLKQADQVMDHQVKSQVEEELRTHTDLLTKLRNVHPHQEMPSSIRDEMEELLDRLDVIMATEDSHKQTKLQQDSKKKQHDSKKKSKTARHGVNMQQLHAEAPEQIADKSTQEALQEAHKKASLQDEKEVLALTKQAAALALKDSKAQVESESKAVNFKLGEQTSEDKPADATEKQQGQEVVEHNQASKAAGSTADEVIHNEQHKEADEKIAKRLAKQTQQLHAMLKKIRSSPDDASFDKTSRILEQHQQLLQHLVKSPKENITETLKEVQAVIANIKANLPHKEKESSLEKH